MIVKIEKRKAYEHIVGSEFSEEFSLPENKDLATEAIHKAINDFIDFREGDLEEWLEQEIAELKQFEEGKYALDVGDFNYYVYIKNEGQ